MSPSSEIVTEGKGILKYRYKVLKCLLGIFFPILINYTDL